MRLSRNSAAKAPLQRAALNAAALRRTVKLVGAVAILAACGLGIGWVTTSGTLARAWTTAQDRLIAFSATNGLAVDQVLVSGRNRTVRAELVDAIGVDRGMPLLTIDLDRIRERVEALPWIGSAKVSRHFPDRIAIALAERVPMALWQRRGAFALVDRTGSIIPGQDIRRFAHLPVLTGEDAPAEAAALLAMLQGEPTLAQRVRGAARVSGRRWNLMLDNGVTVRLPEVRPEQAWTKLAAYERDHRVLSRDIVAIDLRFDDRLVVRVSPDAGTLRRDAGQST